MIHKPRVYEWDVEVRPKVRQPDITIEKAFRNIFQKKFLGLQDIRFVIIKGGKDFSLLTPDLLEANANDDREVGC